jgi:hypothetical protein
MVSASKAKRDAKKAASGKTSKLSSKAASKNASAAASGDEQELDAHGNVIQKDEPATGEDKMGEVKRLADQIDHLGVSYALCGLSVVVLPHHHHAPDHHHPFPKSQQHHSLIESSLIPVPAIRSDHDGVFIFRDSKRWRLLIVA